MQQNNSPNEPGVDVPVPGAPPMPPMPGTEPPPPPAREPPPDDDAPVVEPPPANPEDPTKTPMIMAA